MDTRRAVAMSYGVQKPARRSLAGSIVAKPTIFSVVPTRDDYVVDVDITVSIYIES